jgi:hypothetical protein
VAFGEPAGESLDAESASCAIPRAAVEKTKTVASNAAARQRPAGHRTCINAAGWFIGGSSFWQPNRDKPRLPNLRPR